MSINFLYILQLRHQNSIHKHLWLVSQLIQPESGFICKQCTHLTFSVYPDRAFLCAMKQTGGKRSLLLFQCYKRADVKTMCLIKCSEKPVQLRLFGVNLNIFFLSFFLFISNLLSTYFVLDTVIGAWRYECEHIWLRTRGTYFNIYSS